jgi:hypothetical protein
MRGRIPPWPLLLVVGAFVLEVAALWSVRGVPDSRPVLRRFALQLDELESVSQTFRIGASGFDSVTVFPVAGTQPPRGRLLAKLVDVSGDREVWVRTIPAADLVAGRPYRLSFEPQADSRGRNYRLEFSRDGPGVEGVALRAGRGGGDPPYALVINNHERWAELAYDTTAAGARLIDRVEGRLAGVSTMLPFLVFAVWLAAHLAVLALASAIDRVLSVRSVRLQPDLSA